MGWPKCNQTEEYEHIDEAKIAGNMEFHHLGLILSALFGLISIFVSAYLIFMHCTHYLKPWEQKHIIRILFMVPIYSFVSFISYLFYRHAVYFEVIRDCYEAFAIASFFFLLCHYLAPDLHSQKNFFRGLVPRNWVWPIPWLQRVTKGQDGIFRVPRSGLTWFNIIYAGIFQYCFVRVFMTLVALVTQAAGIYCLESLSPAFAHVWVMVIEGACVTIAMYCVIQFYIQLKDDLAEHKPLLKVAAIKLVIFLSFWQTLLISFLTSSGAINPSAKFQMPDIKVGIPSMLICIEMAIFSVFHLWAFPWQVYDIRRSEIVASESAPGFLPDPKNAYQGGKLGVKALWDAFNPWDFVKAVGRAFRWLFVGRRKRTDDISYTNSRTQGAGLEPTRDQFTAFQSTDGAAYRTSDPPPYGAGQKPYGGNHYRSLSSEDQDRLLMNAQGTPSSNPYGKPMGRGPARDPALGPQDASIPQPARSKSPYMQDQTGHLMAGGPDARGRSSSDRGDSFDSQDTGYHSPSSGRSPQGTGRRVTPTSGVTPDERPLGPAGRNSREQAEWDLWGGIRREERGEDERDLGGGHGVGDNRF